jgi:hypothetical protein
MHATFTESSGMSGIQGSQFSTNALEFAYQGEGIRTELFTPEITKKNPSVTLDPYSHINSISKKVSNTYLASSQ